MTTLPDKELLRVDEVAHYFGVTARTVYTWIKRNQIEVKRTPGKQIRVLRESIMNKNGG